MRKLKVGNTLLLVISLRGKLGKKRHFLNLWQSSTLLLTNLHQNNVKVGKKSLVQKKLIFNTPSNHNGCHIVTEIWNLCRLIIS